jgi:twinkle protein
LDRGKDCALRMGITDVLIDPFNELEQGHGREMSETQFIGQCLQRANAFALRHGCNVWIVAHPAKPPLPRAGEAPTVPNGYSINGSAHWFNKCTLGITVHRLAEKTQIHVWKAKFRRLGNKGGMAEIGYDTITGRYKMLSTPDSYDNAYARASRGS